MADDLGYGDLACYGQEYIKTPNIDRLAEQGMKFTNFYAGSMTCAPSRCTLMTGQHTGRTIVRSNLTELKTMDIILTRLRLKKSKKSKRRVGLRDEDFILPELLKAAGYVTGMIGKWGLGEEGTSGKPNEQGFDEWFGYLNQDKAHDHFAEKLWKNDTEIVIKENLDDKKEKYSHNLFEEEALDFIRRYLDRKFFLYLPFTLPHNNYEIPDQGIYKDYNWTEEEKNYAAMVSLLDSSVGKIMKLLGELGLDRNTMVFFCSDNGAPEFPISRFKSNGRFKGSKHQFYEGGLRVPMIVKYPERIAAGVTSDEVWYLPDVMPTIADLLGIDLSTNVDGISVWPLLTENIPSMPSRILYWEGYQPELMWAARWNNWKAIQLAPEKPIQLYDLYLDHSEQSDVSHLHTEIVAKFESFFLESHTFSPFWPKNSTIETTLTDN
ncbi:MAG: N-acetylgalactosamine-6-sulfatase [Cyclobacteriaceae bacterium]|nr:MAG: N-acetylgalactosamine-6-sulfatase [Cyclobacteriaceae bacterium]